MIGWIAYRATRSAVRATKRAVRHTSKGTRSKAPQDNYKSAPARSQASRTLVAQARTAAQIRNREIQNAPKPKTELQIKLAEAIATLNK